MSHLYAGVNLGGTSFIAVISDRNVAPLYGKAVQRALVKGGFESVLITVPAGETAKRLKTAQSCYGQLAAHRLERSGCCCGKRRGECREDGEQGHAAAQGNPI